MTISSFVRFLLIAFILSSLILNLTACKKTNDDLPEYTTTLEGWSDIPLPEKAVFERTLISGKTENHYYSVTLSEPEIWGFFEEAMIVNGWAVNKNYERGREFTKEKTVVNIRLRDGINENTMGITIIIEPRS